MPYFVFDMNILCALKLNVVFKDCVDFYFIKKINCWLTLRISTYFFIHFVCICCSLKVTIENMLWVGYAIKSTPNL